MVVDRLGREGEVAGDSLVTQSLADEDKTCISRAVRPNELPLVDLFGPRARPGVLSRDPSLSRSRTARAPSSSRIHGGCPLAWISVEEDHSLLEWQAFAGKHYCLQLGAGCRPAQFISPVE